MTQTTASQKTDPQKAVASQVAQPQTAQPQTARPAAPALPATRAAAPLPAQVTAEIARHAAYIQAHLTRPDEIAGYLARLIDEKTDSMSITGSTTDRLGSAVKDLAWYKKAGVNIGAAVLLPSHASADLTTGSTRKTAYTRLIGRSTVTARPVIATTPTAPNVTILKAFLERIPQPLVPKVMAAYARARNKTLGAELGELIRDASQRAQLLALLPAPIAAPTLALDGFLEQLAVGMSYSNQSADELNADTHEDRRGSNPAALLKHFGFRAGPPIFGRWGFQMRMFYPVHGKARWPHPVATFRGTEGVQFDPDGSKAVKASKEAGNSSPAALAQVRQAAVEGSEDTMIGDASPAQVGYLQYLPNAELIEQNLEHSKSYGRAYATGHSLGGAIAQIVTASLPDHVFQTVTFQAANIDKAMVDRLLKHNGMPGATPVQARHYRIEGDAVPTAGQEALPGQINYFDRVSRPVGSAAPFGSTTVETASSGHVTPMLSTYIRGQNPQSGDLKALSQYGMRDEATLASPGKREVKTVFAGDYVTENDPRYVLEEQRKIAAKLIKAKDSVDLFEQVFYEHIEYNTLLSYIEPLAKTSKTYEAFRVNAQKMIEGADRLKMTKQETDLASALGVDMVETNYAKPMPSFGTYGAPSYQLENSKYYDFKKDGVPILEVTKNTVLRQLRVIWDSWRSS